MNSANELQASLRDQLKSVNDMEANKKQLLASELQPVSVALTDMASDKIRALTNEGIKYGSNKAVDFLKNNVGIDLLAKKEELTNEAKNMLSHANLQANALMGQANDHILNNLSFARDESHSFLNGFSNLEEDFHSMPILPHFNEEIQGAEQLGTRLLSKL